jgi:hypothetical protein
MKLFSLEKALDAMDVIYSLRPIRYDRTGEHTFTIKGRSDKYEVGFSWSGEQLLYECSCPARVQCWHVSAMAAVYAWRKLCPPETVVTQKRAA